MQTTIGSESLKPFTRALACLCRYGDEITIHASPGWFSLSVVGVNRTSFCRFKFLRTFFERGYRIGQPSASRRRDQSGSNSRENEDELDVEELSQITGVILGKPLLAVLKGSGTDKSAERCQLEFIEGVESSLQTSEEDSMETRLVVKLFYKHGITRTHTFAISEPISTAAPALPHADELSSVQIGGRTLKELIEHFPRHERRSIAATEPLLIWQFHHDRTVLKTEDRWNSSRGDWIGSSKGKKVGRTVENDDDGTLIYSSLNSQLTLSDSEFDVYQVRNPPVTLALHLKELNATLAAAEGLGADILVRFTAQGEPLYFSIESSTGTYSSFCAISTKVVQDGQNDGVQPGGSTQQGITMQTLTNSSVRKRQRDEEDREERSIVTKRKNITDDHPSFANVVTSTPRARSGTTTKKRPIYATHNQNEEEPLFLLASSEEPSQILKEAGLDGMERLTQQELRAIMDDDMEVETDGHGATNDGGHVTDHTMTRSNVEDETSDSDPPYGATQEAMDDDFRPLFED
ncbi:hypothetical protein FS842_008281 [Serendipita sp. 407]|nr:hypothetical protein FS842_008281 [Serendipita sp. 407]